MKCERLEQVFPNFDFKLTSKTQYLSLRSESHSYDRTQEIIF